MVALVLSGGGNRGALQAGALQVLLGAGVRPALLVGTSAGAVNAAFLAAGPTPRRAAELAGLWRGLSGRQVFPGSVPLRFWRLARRGDDLYSPAGLRRLLEASLPYRRLEDAAVPLVVVATDLATGLERRLSAGPVIDAVLASAAIPGVFPPVRWEGALLVDGGIAASVPLAAAAAWGAAEAWVLDTARPCEHPRRPRSAVDIALQAVALAATARAQGELACPPAGINIRYLPLSCAESLWFSDFRDTPALIARGAQLAQDYLRSLAEPLCGPGTQRRAR
jgi:NTE family protein